MIRRALVLAAGVALVSAAPASGRDYVGLVNPWVEADRGRFFFFQAATTPFGFAKLRPDTSTSSTAGSGYTSTQNEVKGFSHVHEWRLSGVQVMPTTGPPVPKLQGDEGWQSAIDHAREVAEPGYQRVHLDRYGITAELTTTDRVGLHRYTYDKAGPSEVDRQPRGRARAGDDEGRRRSRASGTGGSSAGCARAARATRATTRSCSSTCASTSRSIRCAAGSATSSRTGRSTRWPATSSASTCATTA